MLLNGSRGIPNQFPERILSDADGIRHPLKRIPTDPNGLRWIRCGCILDCGGCAQIWDNVVVSVFLSS